MNKNISRNKILVGLLFVAFNVIAFACPFAKNAVFWVSYIFTDVAILAQYYVMHEAFNKGKGVKSRFYGFPIAAVGAVYLGVQLVLGVLFMVLAKIVPFYVPFVLYVIALCAAAAGFVAADAMREEINRQDTKLKKDVSTMRRLQSEVNYLVSQCSDPAVKKAVSALAEKLKYSDPVSNDALAEADRELAQRIEELAAAVNDGEKDSALSLCKRAVSAIENRNRLCKLNK